eukprot:TRINITY_DN39330_c0_g1_i1.p1 TRINITY_DN39330_c0_g1~~TRINITY_DN39330_c0_g1_i1.p1  ORF type:complete len:1015 (+),score=116.43 TRINITY_DN39330_c0_g1_i1:182-3046(+)
MGLKLPPGVRVEVKDISAVEASELPPFLRDLAAGKSGAGPEEKKKKADDLPDVITVPPPETQVSESSADSEDASSSGVKRRGGRKSKQDDPDRVKSPAQSIMDLFSGKGVKSFVLGSPLGVKAESEETVAETGLRARDWYLKQLPGSTADNPLDVNYFDWSSSDLNYAVLPSSVEASSIDAEFPWPADAKLPTEMRISLNDKGELTRICVPCEENQIPESEAVYNCGAQTRIEFSKHDDAAMESKDASSTIAFTCSAGRFFSPNGDMVKRVAKAEAQLECGVCSSASTEASEIYTTGGEEKFLVCGNCLGHARTLRENGYAALAGSEVAFRHTAGEGAVASAGGSVKDLSGTCSRFLGGPVGNSSQADDPDENDSMLNPLMGGQQKRTFKVEKDVDVRFADVIGQEIAVEKLHEFVDILRYPDSYDVVGSKVPKGGMLTGPPGTGKTLLAQAVAGECQLPFISVQGSEFNESLVGSGPRNVRTLFKTARKQAALHGGCIVFIDEIDSIGRSRNRTDNSSASQGYCDTLNQLLAEIDGFHSKTDQIVLIAATNRIDVLDKALLRAGRFDRVIPVDRPNIKEREALFWHYLKKLTWREGNILGNVATDLISGAIEESNEVAADEKRKLRSLSLQLPGTNQGLTSRLNGLVGTFVKPRVDLVLTRKEGSSDTLALKAHARSILKIGSKHYVANDSDVSSVNEETLQAIGRIVKAAAKMTTGFTGATINSICNEAGIMAVREKIRNGEVQSKLIVTSVEAHHIAKAIDFVSVGSEKRNFQIRPEEKASVAYHESGHAVVAALLEHHPNPVKVTIVPRDSGSLGFMMPGEPISEVRQSKSQLEAQICVLMGGRISEEIFCDDIAAGAKSDIEQATHLAREYVTAYGMGAGNLFLNTTDDRGLSEAAKARRDESIATLIQECYEKTRELLLEHRGKVQLLQERLLEKETLLADDIKAIVN